MKRWIAAAAVTVSLLLLGLGVSALTPMLPDEVTPPVFLSQGSVREDFSAARLPDGFGRDPGVAAVTVRAGAEIAPYVGEYCVSLGGTRTADTDTLLSFTAKDGLPDDTKWIGFAVCLPDEGDDGAEYAAAVRLYAGEDLVDWGRVTVPTGRWQPVLFRLEDGTDPAEITRVSFGVVYGGAEGDFRYYLDSFFCSDCDRIETRMRFMSESFTVSGGTLAEEDGALILTADGTDPYLETDSFNAALPEGATSLLVRLKNETDCREARLYGTTASDAPFSETRYESVPLESCGEIQNLVFPARPDMTQFCLVFPGELTGKVTVLSIGPAGYYTAADTGLGRILSCNLTANGREILVSGELEEETAGLYRGLQLQLYELHDGLTAADIESGTAASVAYCEVGDTFSFRVPAEEDGRSRIGSRFAVGVVYNGSFRLIDRGAWITNPEAAAEETGVRNETPLVKGMNVNASELYMLSPGHVSVEVRMDTLLQRAESACRWEENGKVWYFNEDAVAALDRRLTDCHEAGVSASLVVSLHAGGAVTSVLDPSGAVVGSYCLPRCDTEESASLLRAVFGFLSLRYGAADAAHGRADHFVFGYGVGGDTGDLTPAAYAEAYALAYGTAYAAVRSHHAAADVYLWLPPLWDSGLDTLTAHAVDGRTFLDLFAAVMKDLGDLDWKIALDPAAGGGPDYAIETEDGWDAPFLCMKNIGVLARYLERQALLRDGETREVLILSSRTYDGTDPGDCADFLFACYQCVMQPCIRAFIVPYNAALSGLFCDVDTDATVTAGDRYLEVTGASSWEELIPGFTYEAAALRQSASVSLDTGASSVVGEVTLFDFDGDCDGWEQGLYVESRTAERSLSDRSGVMIAHLRAADAAEWRGVGNVLPYPMDFTAYPYLRFEMQILSLPPDVTEAEVTAICLSGHDVIRGTATVTGGSWCNVTFPIGSFAGLGNVERIFLLIRGTDGEDLGEPVLVLSGVHAGSNEHGSEYLMAALESERARYTEPARAQVNMNVVWILIIIILTALTVGVINLMSRLRVGKKEKAGAEDPFPREDD